MGIGIGLVTLGYVARALVNGDLQSIAEDVAIPVGGYTFLTSLLGTSIDSYVNSD
jgi:hypothetical protein